MQLVTMMSSLGVNPYSSHVDCILHSLMIKPNRLVYASILKDVRMNFHGTLDPYPVPHTKHVNFNLLRYK